MSKRMENPQIPSHRDDAPEPARSSAIVDIARQIAVLVVRQHRRLQTEPSARGWTAARSEPENNAMNDDDPSGKKYNETAL